MWLSVASNALSFFVVAIFLLAGVVIWGAESYRAEGPLEQAICLRVERGSTMWDVTEDLGARGAIGSPTLMRMGAQYSERADDLKAGNFLVPEGASMAEIVGLVTGDGVSTCGTRVVYRLGVNSVRVEVERLDPESGSYEELVRFDPGEVDAPEEYREVTAEADTQYMAVLAEGVTAWQVVQELEAISTLEGEAEEIPPEGWLAPDSYVFRPGDTVEELLAEMRARQERVLAEEWAARADGLPYETPEEALIMASIVEKETGLAEERPQVASVFVNRLREGWRLQTDPTVIYGVTEGRGVLGRGLRQSELREGTPWNTYVIDGLPATPIANPGRASIRAALNPDTTEFMYFVADGTGGHAFARTLDEHNRNVARWREIEAQREAQDG